MRRFAGSLLLIMGLFVASAGWASKPPPPKTAAQPLRIRDVNGTVVTPLEGKDRKAAVFFFIAHDCPIANGYAPEIKAIYEDFAPRKIAFYAVYVEDDLPASEAKRHAQEYGYVFSALRDPAHRLVKALKATTTPEAVVVSENGKTVYQGRIDDRVVDFGKLRHQPHVRDLREALDALLENKPIRQAKTKPVGCYITGTKAR